MQIQKLKEGKAKYENITKQRYNFSGISGNYSSIANITISYDKKCGGQNEKKSCLL